jgi:hypothetical protein
MGFTSLDAIEVIETPMVLTAGTYDDGQAALSYTGMWGNMTGVSGPYADTLHYSYYVGDSLQVAFSGRQFKLSYLTGTNAGRVDVYVDGVKVGQIDQSSPGWGWQKKWTSDLFPAGTHNLRLVYASGVESFVSLDAIEVIETPVVLGAGTYEDVNAAFTYDGSWGTMTGVSGPSEGTLHYSYAVGDSVQVSFSGEQVELKYLGSPESGVVDVYVDGIKVASLDQTSESWDWQRTWQSDELAAGDHSLRLIYVSGPSTWSFVSLDALTVDP